MSSSLFLLLTIIVVLLDKWTHIAGTYDSATGKAKIYVNGELRNMTIGEGLLSRDWLSRAGIGDHKAARPLMGFIDEFRIYNYALPKADIEALSKMCVPGMPTSICYSLHINIFFPFVENTNLFAFIYMLNNANWFPLIPSEITQNHYIDWNCCYS